MEVLLDSVASLHLQPLLINKVIAGNSASFPILGECICSVHCRYTFQLGLKLQLS